jgi:hypothetical protein
MREQSLLQHMQGSLTLQSLSWQRPMPSILAPTAADWQWLPARPNMGLLLESTVATQPHHGVVSNNGQLGSTSSTDSTANL